MKKVPRKFRRLRRLVHRAKKAVFPGVKGFFYGSGAMTGSYVSYRVIEWYLSR
ncbi:hypothetical protein [Streptomyces lydicus]|uniref:hypothetical protein n=1 Tax=Streptomyces lydicus TaxID=47763 RepID=UPI0037245792